MRSLFSIYIQPHTNAAQSRTTRPNHKTSIKAHYVSALKTNKVNKTIHHSAVMMAVFMYKSGRCVDALKITHSVVMASITFQSA